MLSTLPFAKEQFITCCLHFFFPQSKGIYINKRHCIYPNEMQKKINTLKKCLVLTLSFYFLYFDALKPTSPEPTPPTTFSRGFHTQGSSSPALIAPGPAARQQTRDSPGVPGPTETIQTRHPKPIHPASSVSFCRNNSKCSCPHFPLFPLPPKHLMPPVWPTW